MSNFNSYVLINYEEYVKFNKDIMDKKLNDLECKHILFKNKKTNLFFNLAKKVDYKWVIFGSHRKLKEEDRVKFEIDRINDMANSSTSRAVKIVKTSDGKYFADNTHWVLAYIKRFGENVRLKEIPFYLVDFCKAVLTIVDVNNSVIKNDEDIKKAVASAGDIEERIKKGWRPKNISYKIRQLN